MSGASPGEPRRARARSGDGTELAIEAYGSGDGVPVLLVDAVGAARAVWRPVRARLARRHVVLARALDDVGEPLEEIDELAVVDGDGRLGQRLSGTVLDPHAARPAECVGSCKLGPFASCALVPGDILRTCPPTCACSTTTSARSSRW